MDKSETDFKRQSIEMEQGCQFLDYNQLEGGFIILCYLLKDSFIDRHAYPIWNGNFEGRPRQGLDIYDLSYFCLIRCIQFKTSSLDPGS